MRSPTLAQTPVTTSKLGYVGFETPDLERLVDYYTTVLDVAVVERSGTEAYLTTTADHHSIVLRRGGQVARSVVGYQIREELDSAQRRLEQAGCAAQKRTDPAPGVAEVLVLTEPVTGVPIHLYTEQQESGVTRYPPLRPTKLGHVAAFVDDLAPVQAFYQDVLGFRWSDTIGDFFVFLRCNADHHAVNFLQSDSRQGMNHIAYEMRDLNHLQTMLDHLAHHGFRLLWGPGRHGPGHNIFSYHTDPDGNVVELFTQLDCMVDESLGYFEPRPWHTDFPQYPKTWEADLAVINSWGPINPEFLER